MPGAAPEGFAASRRFARPRLRCLVLALLGSIAASAPAARSVQAQRPQDPAGAAGLRSARLSLARQPALEVEGDSVARPVRAVMAAQLADNLALLFERFGDSEFIVCIEGGVEASGDFSLRDFRMPHIAYSRATGAGVHPDGDCSQYADIIGTLHSHPATYPQDRGREWGNCYLSRPDIVSWLDYSTYPYTMVMCGPRTWAWWHRSQVDRDRVLALPPPGQLYGRPDEEVAAR